MDQRAYYLQSPHGNPAAFQQIKMNPKLELRTPKPPKPPEKPLMPYMRYSKKVWEQVKNSNPHLKLWEVGKIIGQMWRELPDDEKNLYNEEYDAEKAQYNEALRQYHSSPAYQAWLVAKERAEKMLEEHDQERKAMARGRDRSMDLGHADLRESYILEDNEEDAEEQYTAKHVAAARFQRNHRLMQEILSDSRLPDPGQLITQSRLHTLRSQVEQLKNHKRNLCQEIECCESRHRSRLKRIQEDSEKFIGEYKKLTLARPVITETSFTEMLIKAKADMKKEEEERLSRYLAEMEMRRRKQRQQHEAELAAENERRRQQQLHQQQIEQSRAQQEPAQPDGQTDDSNQPSMQVDKNNQDGPPMPKPTNAPPSIAKPEFAQSDAGPTVSSPPVATPPQMPPAGGRFSQPGHTQHHYPPPPNYPPNSISPSSMQGMPRAQSPFPQQQPQQLAGPRPGFLLQGKKNYSTGSPVPAASGTSAKRKNSDGYPEGSTERKPNGATPDRRPEEIAVKGAEFTTSGAPSEYVQSSGAPSPAPRAMGPQHYAPAPQQPMAGPSAVPPGSQPPFGFEHNAPPGSIPAGYYHGPPQPPGQHPPGFVAQGRAHFGHGGYVTTGQYPPHQASADHPPPPMYVQHIPQQPPHLSQQGQLSSSVPHAMAPPVNPHQAAAMGWHQSGYPPQYGPPRYMGPGGPVGYTGHPVRHMSAGAYAMHPYQGMHHPHQQAPPVSSAGPESSTGQPVQQQQQQPIPAPPPYQQQQQQQQQQHMQSSGYWPMPHAAPAPDYTNQQYGSAQQHEVSGPHGPNPDTTTGHAHPEGTSQQPTQPHHSAMYYPGYPHPSMQGSYGPTGPGGFYAVPPQHQGPQGAQYTQGPWPGYPPHMAMQQQQHQPGPPHAGYPPHPHMQPPQQQQQQQQPNPSPVGVISSQPPPSTTMDATPVSGGTSASQPPSVSSQGQA